MKAKTKNQKRVVRLNELIKPLSKTIQNWAKKTLFKEFCFRSKTGTMNCLKCGHSWKDSKPTSFYPRKHELHRNCPSCRTKLKIVNTQKRTYDDYEYFHTVTKIHEYQLIRSFIVYSHYKTKTKARYNFLECHRVFIDKNGKQEVIARLHGSYYYSKSPSWNNWLELRNPKVIEQKYDDKGELYPKWDLQDYSIKAGLSGEVYHENKFTVRKLLEVMLGFTQYETLYKASERGFCKMCFTDPNDIKEFWPSIKIVMRHKYHVRHVPFWIDMLKALKSLGKDLHSPHYIMPSNQDEAHDYWIDKIRKRNKKLQEIAAKERAIKRKQRILEQIERDKHKIEEYNARMIKFKDLKFCFGELEIVPLMTTEDVRNAGELLNHCIYETTDYWTDSNRLLFGTYVKGKLIETSEYRINSKIVNHSYGFDNKESKYHKKIVKIIETGSGKIDACLRKKRKTRSKNQEKQVA